MDKVDIPGAKVGDVVAFARMEQAASPGRRPDGQGDAPWPKRVVWYSGVVGTVAYIRPRAGIQLGEVRSCHHHHGRAAAAVACARKLLGEDAPMPRVAW